MALGPGWATLPVEIPKITLGWHVAEWMMTYLRQPNGPQAGEPFVPTDGQVLFLLHWYGLGEDGRWLYRHGVRRLAKGSGKSPFAAALALAEYCGPVRLLDIDMRLTRHGCTVAKPVAMPLVQIAATAESQTANTMRMVRAFARKGSRVQVEYGIDVGKTKFYKPDGGELEIITSSAATAEGAEVTFAVEDETEHWVPSAGGVKLAETIERNLKKSNSRALETSNAWEPGLESVAETTWGAWETEQEGRVREGVPPILYDARIAPAGTDMGNGVSLMHALDFVYEDCPWVDRLTIRNAIWDPRTPEDQARRFYLNQPTAAEDAWTTPTQWGALEDKSKVVEDGASIAMFFDGSKSNDATALVGCRMSDGHVFLIDSWEPLFLGHDVPVEEVNARVAYAFGKWDICGFFADVQEWESFVKVSWPDEHVKDKKRTEQLLVMAQPTGKDAQPIAWDMRSRTFEFTKACELVNGEIIQESFTHDGNPVLTRHVVNARRLVTKYGISVHKESRASSKKIDAAVCMIGARMVRQLVLASGKWPRKRGGSGRVIVLE